MARYDSGIRYGSGARYDEAEPQPLPNKSMRYIKLLLGSKTVDEKITQGNAIKAGLTGNPNFPSTNPSLTAFGNGITDLGAKKTARINAIEAAKAATEALHAAEQTYDTLVTQLAANAEGTVLGDPVKLESANFQLRTTPSPIKGLGQVQSLKLTSNTYAGKLFACWAPVRGAKAYELQISPDPVTPSSWRSLKPSTTSRTVIEDLTSAAKMWLQVRAVSKRTEGPWSQPACKVVP